MKKIILILTAIALAFSLFAGGTNEIPQSILNNIQTNAANANDKVQNSLLSGMSSSAAGDNAVIERNMATLTRLYKTVVGNYLYDIDHEAVYNAMATALFEALDDKYSEFIPSEDKQDFDELTTGVFGGIGILFSKPDEYILIEQVYPNTPASKAGLQARDRIVKIEGEDISNIDINECSTMMRGEIGTSVTVTVLRNEKSFDLKLVRDLISTPAVEYTMLDNGVAYIIISKFYSSTPAEVANALRDLSSKGMKSLIIDLRECPGGDVDATLEIADMFISDAELLNVSFKDSNKNVVYWANKSVLVDPSVNIAILVDGGTASSAEILSSTMRDNNRAVIIGEKTFGKGIMQAVSQFGNSEYKLTIANYFPPSGYKIHENGILPDIEVSQANVPEDQIDAYMDLYEGTLISDFVKAHPDYSIENVELFIKENQDIALDSIIIKCMVRNEYIAKMPYDERPIADTWFDSTITTAIEYLTK